MLSLARVLFLTQVLPHPLNSGAKIRAYYVLRHLARRHDVTLVSFVREDDDPASVAHVGSFCHAVRTVVMARSPLRDGRALLRGLLTGMPIVIARDEIGAMKTALRRVVADGGFDVVHADQTSMVPYGLYARRQATRRQAAGRPALVLDAHNALYRVPERMARHEANPVKRALYRREARALRRYERAAYAQFDHVVFVTAVDQATLFAPQRPPSPLNDGQLSSVPPPAPEAVDASQPSNLQPMSQACERSEPSTFNLQPSTSVIPICVDPARQPLIQREPHPRTVTHLGTMFWPPNVEGVLWFAREVWPRVVDRVPDARFAIIGKDPPREVQELGTAAPRVDVTGYVADPEPYLAQTGVFIVPLRAGGGMRVKILDGWCWGVPVVSTSIGAEGIDIEDGTNILIADEPAGLAEAVVRVLRDPALGEALRHNGRRWVEERYHWRRVYPEWDRVYHVLTQGR